MISIIGKPRKLRRFNVYDFEWVPGTLEMRLCGFFDGENYRSFPTIAKFLECLLSKENAGTWNYAHAGGLADVQFVLEHILEHGGEAYEVEAKFSGASAISVEVRRGKYVWHLCDSYWLLRDSLKRIGKAIGLEKGGPSGWDEESPNFDEATIKEWYRSAPLAELRPYNEQDCRILWTAISEFESILLEQGGELQRTIASCGMNLFRRRFLTENIDTYAHVNLAARRGYYASRVEVFERHCKDAYYYDINSSFAFAMTKPCPGPLVKTHRRGIPNYDRKIFMADVEISVPENYLPVVPYRHNQSGLYFPTGNWRSWFTSVDLEMMEDEGVRITKLHEVMEFAPFYDLADYANTIYSERLAAQKDGNSYLSLVYKYLLNSLYGKFAESAEKSTFLWNPSAETLANLREDDGTPREGVTHLFPGAWLQDKAVDVPHMHVPISAHITAEARRTLHTFMSYCDQQYYCDTDGFATTDELTPGSELGDIKLEKYIDEAEFHQPKGYRIDGRDEKNKPLRIRRFKGMSLGKTQRAQELRYTMLQDGYEIPIHRMSRLKEQWRREITKPREATIWKGVRGTRIEKRFTYPDGSTRPWSVDELGQME